MEEQGHAQWRPTPTLSTNGSGPQFPFHGAETSPAVRPPLDSPRKAHPIRLGLRSRCARSAGCRSCCPCFRQVRQPCFPLTEHSGQPIHIECRSFFHDASPEPGMSGCCRDQKSSSGSPSKRTDWPHMQTPCPFGSVCNGKGKSFQTCQKSQIEQRRIDRSRFSWVSSCSSRFHSHSCPPMTARLV